MLEDELDQNANFKKSSMLTSLIIHLASSTCLLIGNPPRTSSRSLSCKAIALQSWHLAPPAPLNNPDILPSNIDLKITTWISPLLKVKTLRLKHLSFAINKVFHCKLYVVVVSACATSAIGLATNGEFGVEFNQITLN